MPESRGRLDLLAVGETMAVFATDRGSQDSPPLVSIGGAESNVAAHLVRLGRSAAWVSAVGVDDLGAMILRELTAAGVDTRAVKRDQNARTGVYWKNTDGEVTYYRRGSAASRLSLDALQTARDWEPTVVHISGITPTLSPSCREMVRAIVLDRWFGSALMSFDVNYRTKLWAVNRASSELHELAQGADIVFVGRDEAEALWGTRTAEEIRGLLPRPGNLVVKDGSLEAVEFEGSKVVRVAARPADLVDAIGAGDAFAGGWLSALLGGATSFERLSAGHESAVRTIARSGDW